MADYQKQVDELVSDLKKKIDDITNAADDVDGEGKAKAEEIKNKASKILNIAMDKLIESCQNLSDSPEFQNGINEVKDKSKELYVNALNKINEVKNTKTYQNTAKYIKQTADQVKDETKAFIIGTKDNFDELFSSPEVKESIDNAKLKTVDVAEKALDTLKSWLKPEGGDK